MTFTMPEPAAWMYEAEPSFDGNNWHKKYAFTDSEQLAKFMSGTVKQPAPLYTADALRDVLEQAAKRIESPLHNWHATVIRAMMGEIK